MSNERQEQARLQCKALVHLGKALAETYAGYAECGVPDILLEQVGERTAAYMEMYADMLNGSLLFSRRHTNYGLKNR